MFPSEFRAEVNRQETRVMELSSSEDCMIVGGMNRFGMIYRTRRSDGRTESIIAKTALCIASYADALSKIYLNLFCSDLWSQIHSIQI